MNRQSKEVPRKALTFWTEVATLSGIPGAWQELMDRAGITSLRGLSTACGGQPSPKALGDIILRGAPGSRGLMAKLAEVLGVAISDLNAIQTRHQPEPLRLPQGTDTVPQTEGSTPGAHSDNGGRQGASAKRSIIPSPKQARKPALGLTASGIGVHPLAIQRVPDPCQ